LSEICTAIAGKRAEQRGAAEDALRAGASTYQNDGRFPLELGRLLHEDGQAGEAAAALGKIGKKQKEWAEASKLLMLIARSAPSVGGEKVSITIRPLRNGDPGGSFVSAAFPDGRKLGNGAGVLPAAGAKEAPAY
jgi:hypothetical protein